MFFISWIQNLDSPILAYKCSLGLFEAFRDILAAVCSVDSRRYTFAALLR